MALVAERKDPVSGEHEIIAVGRLIKLYGRREAEFALVVADRYQGKGLGTQMLHRLLQIGHDQGLGRITADILAENRIMQEVCERAGFQFERSPADCVVKAAIELDAH
jgi:acetyltransferase